MNELDDNKEVKIMNSKKRKRVVSMLVRTVRSPIQHGYVSSGIGKPSFVHALVVIFLEFFAWGLLTDQVITVLNETFPNSTFLANGLIHGVKGILSFLSAPLVGALSDVFGRKVFLLITVFFTCLPIPLMRINPMWYFAMISISGLFAVTFSVVFAYVADVTDESNRTTTYGLVSATFAASLITSPALGSYLSRFYSPNFVITLATAIAVFDLFFILVAVPESLPEKLREKSKTINWENVDPFKSLKIIFQDKTISLLCLTVFLSYLPEAGQYSCFFVYLKLIVGFSQEDVAYFIAYVGILSCIAQAAILVILIRYFGRKQSIVIGLAFQVLQLAAYAFSAQPWLIWFAGMLAAVSSIGYPAISAYISNHSHADQQGVSQGMVTGIRGLCNGIGPALYGFIFWIFRVSLNETSAAGGSGSGNGSGKHPDNPTRPPTYASTHFLPGPPFLFGSVLALLAIFVTYFIPTAGSGSSSSSTGHKRTSSILIPSTSTTNPTGAAINSNTSASNLINTSQTGNKLLDLSSTNSSPSNTTIIKMSNTSSSAIVASGLPPQSSAAYNRILNSNEYYNNMHHHNYLTDSKLNATTGEASSLVSDLISYKYLQEKDGLLMSPDDDDVDDDQDTLHTQMSLGKLKMRDDVEDRDQESEINESTHLVQSSVNETIGSIPPIIIEQRSDSPSIMSGGGMVNPAFVNTLGRPNTTTTTTNLTNTLASSLGTLTASNRLSSFMGGGSGNLLVHSSHHNVNKHKLNQD